MGKRRSHKNIGPAFGRAIIWTAGIVAIGTPWLLGPIHQATEEKANHDRIYTFMDSNPSVVFTSLAQCYDWAIDEGASADMADAFCTTTRDRAISLGKAFSGARMIKVVTKDFETDFQVTGWQVSMKEGSNLALPLYGKRSSKTGLDLDHPLHRLDGKTFIAPGKLTTV